MLVNIKLNTNMIYYRELQFLLWCIFQDKVSEGRNLQAVYFLESIQDLLRLLRIKNNQK